MKLIIIVSLLLSNIYFIYEKIELNSCYSKLQKDYEEQEIKKKKLELRIVYNSVNEMNLYYHGSKLLVDNLSATSYMYFRYIGKEKSKLLKELNESGHVCNYWTKKTKEQYKSSFLEYYEIGSFNNNKNFNNMMKNIGIFDVNLTNDDFLKGLEITDKICLEKLSFKKSNENQIK